jgi:hypothetical protein
MPPQGEPNPRAAWLVDAHVHLHPWSRLDRSFAAAAGHFRRWASHLRLGNATTGCALLAEKEGEATFRRLQDQGLGSGAGAWSLRPTDEDVSLLACHEGEPRFVLVAGRQVVTVERLEVLTLGTAEPLPHGVTLERAMEHAAAERGLAIIPWGFGKWWFGRGERLRRLVREARPGTFYLGDNGGRPRRFPDPPLLHLAQQRGIWNLPGSDPLPLPGEDERVGSYGYVVPIVPDLHRPFAQIRGATARFAAQPRIFGRRAGLPHFVRAQVSLRRSSSTPG